MESIYYAFGDTDVFDVYRAMRIINPSPYMYFLRLPDRIVAGASFQGGGKPGVG